MLLQERHLCTVDIRVALPEQLKKEHLRGCLVCSHRRRQLLRLLAEQLSEQIAVVLLAWLSAVGCIVKNLGRTKVLILLCSKCAIHIQILLELRILKRKLIGRGQIRHAQLTSICTEIKHRFVTNKSPTQAATCSSASSRQRWRVPNAQGEV